MKEELKSTQDTQESKLIGGNILVMDIAALPKAQGLDVEKWATIIREEGVLFYDSKAGDKPEFINPDEKIVMYDVKDEQVMKDLEEILNSKEVNPEYKGESEVLEDGTMTGNFETTFPIENLEEVHNQLEQELDD